jgi:hypothetical protein
VWHIFRPFQCRCAKKWLLFVLEYLTTQNEIAQWDRIKSLGGGWDGCFFRPGAICPVYNLFLSRKANIMPTKVRVASTIIMSLTKALEYNGFIQEGNVYFILLKNIWSSFETTQWYWCIKSNVCHSKSQKDNLQERIQTREATEQRCKHNAKIRSELWSSWGSYELIFQVTIPRNEMESEVLSFRRLKSNNSLWTVLLM